MNHTVQYQQRQIPSAYNSPSSTNTSPSSTFQRQSNMSGNQSPVGTNTGATTPTHPLAFHQQPRQLHPPKSLLYRPAVLRTTERPAKAQEIPGGNNPLTPPPSQSPSLNSQDGNEDALNDLDFGDGEIAGSEPIYEGSDDEPFKPVQVTGPPSRAHWKPDSEAVTCDNPACIKTFGFFERRHHCRRCGNVFCSLHTPHFLRLDQNCKFNPQGELSRACDSCYNDYRRLSRRRASISSQREGSFTEMPTSPIMPLKKKLDGFGNESKLGSSFVGSVPRDWTWSTF
ncbi:FYVE-domain-containing protein [Ascobolus immersus RN42]|uniref:FYVE-domain-containing protein n=1 Tax=Ascobolus immersus RN42 TaxID=1160509 RepID=A0A3N4ILZ1_ASCIM|nr:FYVE-domain-containing protein [Ascobolus immersus RN42]